MPFNIVELVADCHTDQRCRYGHRVEDLQVKEHYKDRAELSLINLSAERLSWLAGHVWMGKRVALNFPGIGFGGLRRMDVLPLIETLPDNVEVWEYL